LGVGRGDTTSLHKNKINEKLPKLTTGRKQQRRKKMGVRNWRNKSQDREQWRAILEEAKFHQGL
jgi:hypothetical protein